MSDAFEVPQIVPEVGRYEKLPSEVYHRAWQAWNVSRLKKLDRSPAHCHYAMNHAETNESPAMNLGCALHCAVLECDAFEKRYAVDPEKPGVGGYPRGWRNTTEYREAVKHLRNDGMEVLTPEQHEICARVRDRIYSEPSDAREVLQALTAAELSFAIEDPSTGLLCKIRPDAMAPQIVVDLKSCESVQRFRRQIYDLRYHLTPPFYMDLLNTYEPGQWKHFFFLAVETSPPFEFALFELDAEGEEMGRQKVARLMEMARRCVEAGEWPGYPRELQTITLPPWAHAREQEAA